MSQVVAWIKKASWNEWFGWPIWLVTCFLATLIVSGAVFAVAKWLGLANSLYGTLGDMVLSAVIYIVLTVLLLSIMWIRYTVTLPRPLGNTMVVIAAVLILLLLQFIHAASVGVLALLGIATGVVLVLANVPVKKRTVNAKTLGVARSLSWGDIGLGIAGYVIYFMAFVALTIVISKLIPAYNAEQNQDIGFNALYGIERTIGFIVLVIITPIAEELVMRGFLFGKLRQAKLPFWPAAVVVSAIFGLAHGQWNVGVDTFILSMVACYLRELTGTIWPGVIIHMLKNAVAYVMLFIFVIR